ncbi:hypothetical protein NL50_03500 [Clostridium acetobutylicum]|nr:hypothetical protein NL50_03500 [Clostridium acetobutylicum]
MDKLKRKICICMSLAVVIFLCGCRRESKDEMQKDFKKYAENKYAMKFKVRSVSEGQNWITHGLKGVNDKCVLYVENNPYKTFIMTRNHNLIGVSNSYCDGYYNYLIAPLVRERLKGIMKNNFNDFKYYVVIRNDLENSSENGSFDLDTILNQKGDFTIRLYVLVNSERELDKNKMARRVYEFMSEIENSNLIKNRSESIFVDSDFYFVDSNVFNKTKFENIKGGYDDASKEYDLEEGIKNSIPFFDKLRCSIDSNKYDDSVEKILGRFKSAQNN